MLVKCGFCSGDGHHPENYKNPCPVCNGVGQIVIPDKHVKCGFCSGRCYEYKKKTGFWAVGDEKVPCHICSGTGVVIPPKYG